MHTTTENPDAVTSIWHLHQGTVQWFIVGPGPGAMHPCSTPDYASRKPQWAEGEQAVANRALAILQGRGGAKDAGVAEIKAALTAASKPARKAR